MNSFSKILNTISTKENLYVTPFLNFEYSHRSIARNKMNESMKALRNHLNHLNVKKLDLEKKKDKMNQEAFTRVLSDHENEQLAEIFVHIERTEQEKERVQQQIDFILSNG